MGKAEHNKLQKRSSLLDTAFELFTTKGVNKTTVAEIAQQAGMAKGTFYLYFADKYDIRNKLIAHESTKMFHKAVDAMPHNAQGQLIVEPGLDFIKNSIIFIANHIIGQFAENRTLLNFISKNLSWALFKKAITAPDIEAEIDFRQAYYHLLYNSGIHFKDPEIMLFMIIELVSSTSYSTILYEDPADMDHLRPYLNQSISHIIDDHVITEAASEDTASDNTAL